MDQPNSSQYSATDYLSISTGAVIGFTVLLAFVVTGAVLKENAVIRQARRRTERLSRKRTGADNPAGPEAQEGKNSSNFLEYEDISPSTQQTGPVSESTAGMMGMKKNGITGINENIKVNSLMNHTNASNEDATQNDVSGDSTQSNVASEQANKELKNTKQDIDKIYPEITIPQDIPYMDDNADADCGNHKESNPSTTSKTHQYENWDTNATTGILQSEVTQTEYKPEAKIRKPARENTANIELQSFSEKDQPSTGQDGTDETHLSVTALRSVFE